MHLRSNRLSLVLPRQDGGVVSGVGELQGAALRIDQGIKQGYKLVLGRITPHHAVTFATSSLGAMSSVASAFTTACRLDISKAAGMPLPETSPIQRPSLRSP